MCRRFFLVPWQVCYPVLQVSSSKSALQAFFEALFRKGKARAAAEPAQSRSAYIARPPRLRTDLGEHLRNAIFVAHEDRGAFGIYNLSLGGMALGVRPGAVGTPALETILEGQLRIHDSEYPLALKISHVSSQMVGGPFVRTPPKFRERLLGQLAAEFQAAHVAPIRTELLKPEEDGRPIFFCGSDGTELKIVERDGRIVRFHMGFLGMYIEGDGQGRVQFGLIYEDNRSGGKPVFKGATLIGRPMPFNAETQMLAARFVVYVEGLEPRLRDQLLEILAGAVSA